MKFKKYLNLFIILVFSLWIFGRSPSQAQDTDAVKELLNSFSVEQKVGQLFVVPFDGPNVDPESDIGVLIQTYKVGGVVIQASNSNFRNTPNTPADIATLTNQLQTYTANNQTMPLLIAVDREGDGWPYTRITGGTTAIPSAMSIGATWDTQNAYAVGKIVGQELSAMGINLLLGPVLDVLNDPRPSGRGDIGTRTFGGDPFWVGAMGQAYIQGIHEGSNNKLATVAKHFPGHGGSDRLPDNEIATVDKSLQELKRIELAPFFDVTALGKPGATDAMMSSHIRYRGFQGDIRRFTAPISFDEAGMNTLLTLPEFVPWRAAGGLIVSDALGVPAVRKHYDPTLQTFPHRRIAREAFLAGNDILILAQFDLRSIWSVQFENIKDTITFFQNEYRQNKAFANRVDAAVERILRLKLNLFPNLSPNTLMVDPDVALAVSGQGQTVANEIASQSLTLLHPTPAEYAQRFIRPPGGDDKLLIISDVRKARACFRADCDPFEPLPYRAFEDLILQFYGPESTGQIQTENIDSISFEELKQALVGPLIAVEGAETADDTTNESLRPPEEVVNLIQAANWLIFAQLDLNTERYPSSDALKLFLGQSLSGLYNKNIIVYALNSPYYLDTTEINKLSAYFGVYSKTSPHLELAVRTLFDDLKPQGASPVNVDGTGYDLTQALAPDYIRSFPVQVLNISPADLQPPVSVSLKAGPILDKNGNPVPDGTPVEFKASYSDGQVVAVPPASTLQGMAEMAITLNQPGTVEIFALSGETQSQRPQLVTVAAPPDTPTPSPSPSPSPTITPLPSETPTPSATFTPALSPTPSPTLSQTATLTPSPELIVSPTVTKTLIPALTSPPDMSGRTLPISKHVSGPDFLAALGAIILAITIGLRFNQTQQYTLLYQMRLSLITFSGGMVGYLLYGIGWLRPDLWLLPQASSQIHRLMLSFLVFMCGVIGLLIAQQISVRE